MIQNLSKIIVRSIFAIVIILLVVESSLLVPAYMNLVFQTQAVASKGARYNYISGDDIINLEKNLTGNYTNKRYSATSITTTVLEITADSNSVDLAADDVYGNLDTDNKLQRGDSYTLHVEVTYYFLMPNIFQTRSALARRSGIPIPLSYEVPITCLKYFKD